MSIASSIALAAWLGAVAMWIAGVIAIAVSALRHRGAPARAIQVTALGFGLSIITLSAFIATVGLSTAGPLLLIALAPGAVVGAAVVALVVRRGGTDG